MGTVGSHSEGEEEEAASAAAEGGEAAAGPPGASEAMELSSSSSPPPPPPGPAAAAASPVAGGSAGGSGGGFPAAAVLLGQARLREAAAARLREAPSAEPLLSRHHAALLRWLEERLARGEEAVSLEQLAEALESRAGPAAAGGAGAGAGAGAGGTGAAAGAGSGAAPAGGGAGGTAAAEEEERARSQEVLAQFDAEGDGMVDVADMLEVLKNSSGANLQGELSHVIKQLQACSLIPGFIDIFSESKERLSLHASLILRFLHRHRIASTGIPYSILEYFNNICMMRSSVLKDSLDRLLLKEKECPSDFNGSQELDKLKSVSKCYTHIETSSNSADVDKMTNGETSSFWQSDGSARSHWIRLKMKPDIILRHLSIAVAASDQSYMPQQVTVAIGRTASSLQEVRDVHIPSNVTGYVTLLENANIRQMYVQINIKRCLSDGCDTRIHGLRAIGYQRVRKGGVSVSDASAIWYWSLLTSLVTASMETNPSIVHTILQNTQKALQHMPPLSLSPGSTDFSSFLSPNVLEEVDSFLLRISSCCSSPEVELMLLAFALARGSIAKVLSSLCAITDHLETPYKAASLIAAMATVRQNLLYKYGTPLRLTLQACDVKGKEDKSGPENLLVEPWTGDGFLTETGKTRASVILSTGTESAFQVTQIRIKVRRGAIGARCGLVFAYNCSSEKFHAEDHFRRFDSYDKWKLEDFRRFLKRRSDASQDELGEEDPVGWFEMEEEWDEVEVKMQQCRISKFLMIKFLCTRQEKAERLGVQGLNVFGYLRPASAEPNRSKNCLQCDKANGDTVCGTTLLLKTLCFIQQLAQDLVQKKESGLRYKAYLDFSGLDLKLFWNFYSKLHQSPREECIDAQTMILRLLQSCFSTLAADDKTSQPPEAAPSQRPENAEAAEELCKHLFEVVDRSDSESTLLKTLKQEIHNTLLSGGAIFFPNGRARRQQLFAMLKNITEQEHKPSVHLAFKSLCTYFSDQDPGGLLLLPEKGSSASLDTAQVLSVMETLQLVASRECELLMLGLAQPDTSSVLSALFWSVQGSLLSWCYLQLKGGEAAPRSQATEILTKYVQQFLLSVRTILESLLSQHSGKVVVEKLSNSVLAMVSRQLMTFLQDFCTLDIPHCTLLQDVSTLIKLLNDLTMERGESPNKVNMEIWQQEQPVVLRTWSMESPHNYENNCHDVTAFLCPGATYFEVEFDERCETERRYDYLEFTDARGAKTRYDTKVGTDKWPKKVTFKAGPRLQFLFHSDSSNNEWGYKFSVTAYGLPDVDVSWDLDLQLLVARLMGRLASQSMVLKSLREARSEIELPPAQVTAVLNSPLWKLVFRHQKRSDQDLGARETHPDNREASRSPEAPDGHQFLLGFTKPEPAQQFRGPNSDLFQGLTQACKKQAPKTDIVAGSTVDQAVHSTFAALVYLSPDLYGKLQKYVNSGGKTPLSEEFAQVYSLADGIRIWMLEMKQKFLVGQGDGGEERAAGEMSEVNPETLAQQCIQKSLLLLSFLPARTQAEGRGSDPAEDSGQGHKDKRPRTSSIVEADFQAADAAPVCRAAVAAAASVSPEGGQAGAADSRRKPAPGSPQPETPTAPPSSPLDGAALEPEEAASPPSTPTRKPPFSRGRLRLLSFRSMEEARPLPSIKEKHPVLKHALDFIKDQSLSHESVLKVLALRKAQAQSILGVLKMVRQCLDALSQPHCFTPPCIIFLLELLACQKDFTNYFGHLEGCGAELHQEIREAYFQLLLFLVGALKGFGGLGDRSLLPALSCVQASLLHLLDMGWQPSDLSFFVEIQLPQLLLNMSQENISIHDSVVCPWSEEEELAGYRQNCEWMDECQDGLFETWYDKIAQADPEKQRKMHMFIARYCDLLHVDISCDGCDEIAPWHRYRCLQCNDMDLCKTCFLGGAKPEGHEDSHEMVNMEFACDHCQGVIVGQRMNCNVCDDFDLCFGCYAAKKFSESHLPTHSVTAYPLVTIRVSDRQRLIQPYLHSYSWLLFAALALYSADVASGQEVDGETPDPPVVGHARALQQECRRLIAGCLMQVRHEKDRNVAGHASQEVPESRTTPAPCPPSDVDVQSNESQTSEDTEQKGGTESKPPNGLPPKKEGLSPEQEALALKPDLLAEEKASPDADLPEVVYLKWEEKARASPEQVFAECSQKRILGLLAAMLPHLKAGSAVSLTDLDEILPLMFQVVIANAGHLNETYHLTLGLLGQLIRRLTPAQVDAAVTQVLSAKHSLVTAGDGSTLPEGWKTTHLLFSLGTVCLDSRVGLDWACTMADILQALNSSAQWHGVIAAFTDHGVKQLPFQLKHTNIFTLLVLVGFPEVLCTGTRSVYMDNANEAHDVIILKHFMEKNRAVVVDVKTRKRKTVKDYQLAPQSSWGQGESPGQLRQHLQQFVSISSHLLQTSIDSSSAEAVEASWVLSLALKGLYRTLKTHAFEEIRKAFLQTGLLKLLVKKCSRGTGFSKTWLLRDLEILSIMLYSSKKEIGSLAECKDPGLEGRDPDQAVNQAVVAPAEADQNRPDPLEGLDEATKICFLMTHDALDAPLHILRAMYELQMKRTDSFFLEVQKRFDGDVVTTDERIRTLAQKWQPSKRLRSEEQSSKAVDTDMIILPCLSKPAACPQASEESNPVPQKLITTTESDLQASYAKQRRTKSAALLRKELDSRSKKAVRGYLSRVNEATAVLYARHVLALLLAEWPDDVALSEEMLELSGPAHMAYLLDMLMQLEEKPLWEKILRKVLRGCDESMLATMALTACQFMEEPGMATQVRESRHPYNDNTNFEDKVHIPGAIYLAIKFDPQCNTEEGCDELFISSSRDFLHDRHSFSGPPHKWADFELPGDTLYYRFTSDMSNTEWGYKFTVTAGHLGRFQTGFEILKQMLSEERVVRHLPLAQVWAWQVGVACRQTGSQRLKAIHLLLRIVQRCSQRDCDLTLLKPLWQLFSQMETSRQHDLTKLGVLLPLHRALTELFFVTENRVGELGSLQDYLLALNTEDHLHRCAAQALRNIAAISFAINYTNKSTSPWSV
ncbi:zinc finger ZZ-type and EF-hand domain-containing protein 1 isoform X2 [Hemicordylus capensis]|uniref:zinc finger ZZ-type and EF-hand domain-containing protein 1 isoform X2 n=1 Tax=Hemicordylus capensis TaxID=884348 RepID=UPI0023042538|nr:zinc finger ZZ-type and EF-hand domain-containing protein 1 isoform X2 [Hemicordylus capensis]